MATSTRKARLEVRVSTEQKNLCLRAAELQGTTLTEFVMRNLQEAAQRVGNTTYEEVWDRDKGAHPHACGEHVSDYAGIRHDHGSSPRVCSFCSSITRFMSAVKMPIDRHLPVRIKPATVP